jgi:biopolymer transport protein ExbD
MASVGASSGGGRRGDDSTFELNLAPFLDIIVSIIPMLLLSIAFVQVKMVEAPTPQVVSESTATPPVPQVSVALKVSKSGGFEFQVTDKQGKISTTKVPLQGGVFNFQDLLSAAVRIKEMHPEVSSLQLVPEETVAFDDLIKVMDSVREKPRDPSGAKTAQALFPDVVFASVVGG